jgi:signal transduction histidine kinase
MTIDIQTTILMIFVVYLVLHGAIWIVLGGQKSKQVSIWCGSGIISGFAVIFFANFQSTNSFIFFYLAPLLMLLGNWGRQVALRMYLGKYHKRYHLYSFLYALIFMIVVAYLKEFGFSLNSILIWFFGFWVVGCFDYCLAGYQIYKKNQYLGGLLVMAAGSIFCITLGQRSIAILMGWGSPDIYGESIDQGIMILGQMLAITLSNIGFLHIFLSIKEVNKLKIQSELVKAQEKSNYLSEYGKKLQILINEREEMIRQLTLSNKSAGMGALAASFAHELNQPLGAIRLNAQLMERKLADSTIAPSQAKEIIDAVIHDNQRAADIIRKLKNMFNHQIAAEFEPVIFDGLILDTVDLIRFKAAELKIEVVVDVQANIQVRGDVTQLQQVVLNLLNNALDAIKDSNNINRLLKVTLSLNGDHIILQIQDTGDGIGVEIQDFVFQLFKSSKSAGMGIGLWLSQTVINGHGGVITFDTLKGQGTTFTVTLPQ